MPTGENGYPNTDNYPAPSFKYPIPLPAVPPDEGDLIYVGYNPAWIPALMGAVTQLELPSTWQGDHDEIIAALNEVSLLKFQLTEPAAIGGVPTPFWDDQSDLDDEDSPEEQPWYGIFDGEFHETVENFIIAGFIAYSGQPGAAVKFLTIAPAFRLAWKTGDLGGIIRIFIDGADYGWVNTNSVEPGVLQKDFVADPDLEEHEILMYLEAPP